MEGKIVLADLPQADGQVKARPAVVLRLMPPFNDFLLCGVSSQVRQAVTGFDEILQPDTQNRLRVVSVVRLGFLTVLPASSIKGEIGEIPLSVLQTLRVRLADYLTKN
jgi:mRNA interferase MazF